jgi:hypothetical protein
MPWRSAASTTRRMRSSDTCALSTCIVHYLISLAPQPQNLLHLSHCACVLQSTMSAHVGSTCACAHVDYCVHTVCVHTVHTHCASQWHSTTMLPCQGLHAPNLTTISRCHVCFASHVCKAPTQFTARVTLVQPSQEELQTAASVRARHNRGGTEFLQHVRPLRRHARCRLAGTRAQTNHTEHRYECSSACVPSRSPTTRQAAPAVQRPPGDWGPNFPVLVNFWRDTKSSFKRGPKSVYTSGLTARGMKSLVLELVCAAHCTHKLAKEEPGLALRLSVAACSAVWREDRTCACASKLCCRSRSSSSLFIASACHHRPLLPAMRPERCL